jgi:outer membrane protein TolC
MFSLTWHKNLTLNPSPIGEGLTPSHIGEGVGDEVNLRQFTINIILKIFLLIFFALLPSINEAQDLDFYLKQGLANSPLLKDYQNQINASDLDSLLVKAAQLPQANLNGQIMVAPYSNNYGYDVNITNGGNYSGVVAVSQQFLNHKILANKYEGISIQRNSLANSSKISSNDLKRVITNQYLTAFSDLNDLKFNNDFLKILQSQQEIIQQLVSGGIYKQTDYLSLRIELQSLEILIQQLNSQFEKDLRLLNQVCGLNDSVVYNLSVPLIEKVELPNPMLSPLFMQYKIDSFKISNQKIAIENNYRPKLNWFADAGFNSSTFPGVYQHFGFSAGINLSIPIYDGHQRKLQIGKLSISEDSRGHYETFFKNQYSSQVQELNNELSVSKNITSKLEKQLATAKELLTLSKNQLNVGNIGVTEFINAFKSYKSINHDLNQSQVKTLFILNEMNYLMMQ